MRRMHLVWIIYVISLTTGQTYIQEAKLVGTDALTSDYGVRQGYSTALNSIGTLLVVGGPFDNSSTGAVWIFERSSTDQNSNLWSQRGDKLSPSSIPYFSEFGTSVALSSNGLILVVGVPGYELLMTGEVWIFRWNENAQEWSEDTQLIGTGYTGEGIAQGTSVAISGLGDVIAVGGPGDNSNMGAIWIFTSKENDGNSFIQQGPKLIVNDSNDLTQTYSSIGTSLSLSNLGNILAVGGPDDNEGTGAVWIFISNNGIWEQQGSKLVGSNSIGFGIQQGSSVSLSGTGHMLAVGGPHDNSNMGAVWVWMFQNESNTWIEQNKLIAKDDNGNEEIASFQGLSVAISFTGEFLIIGGPGNNGNTGTIWLFQYLENNNQWIQLSKLVGTPQMNNSQQGFSVSISQNGDIIASGSIGDEVISEYLGATWVFSLSNGSETHGFSTTARILIIIFSSVIFLSLVLYYFRDKKTIIIDDQRAINGDESSYVRIKAERQEISSSSSQSNSGFSIQEVTT